MTYKTLLVHVDPTPRSRHRELLAARLAVAHGSHLIGAAMTGISHHVFDRGGFDPADPVLSHHLTQLRAQARVALGYFEATVATVGTDSVESRVIDDEAAGGMALQTRYADLCIIGQFDPGSVVPGVLPYVPETLLLDSPTPVLIVPYAGEFASDFHRPMVAWDGSMQASRAVRGALPLLAEAGVADIVVFNPDEIWQAHGELPGADLALYLARHGIDVNVTERHSDGGTGESLLSAAADLDADLLVMGAYGHTRFREIMLGGVTRTVLRAMTIPVLMTH